MTTKSFIRLFRSIALIEGISLLILLFIAMPLKYFADMPMAVRIFGMAHGILFIAFVWLAWEYRYLMHKSNGWFLRSLIASVLPFGTFTLDRSLKNEEVHAN